MPMFSALLNSERIPSLDGWRGIAILLVTLDHFAQMPTGRLGVEVFFVLSGVLMSRILFEQRTPLRLFYRRRFARTLPVFYLHLVTMVVVGLICLPAINWTNVAATAVFLRSYVGAHIWDDPLGFGHIWSLNVEEHAYLLLALLAFATRSASERKARWLLTALCCIPPLFFAYYRVFPVHAGTPPTLRTECAVFPLVAAAAIYLWVRAYSIRITPLAFCGLLAFTLGLSVLWTVGVARGGTMLGIIFPLALASVVNFLHCAPRWFSALLSIRWLRWFGMISYSLYLWQYPFFRMLAHEQWPFGTVAALLCAVAVASASFYWFERPMRAWLRGEPEAAGSSTKSTAVDAPGPIAPVRID